VTLNILLIVVDTLRADHLGCYGYERDTSPHVDALAGQSAVFERLIAPAIPTHPSFVTINTGQYPITHGVVAHGGTRGVPRAAPWLPSLLQKQGYTTCAIDNLAEWRFGFSQGYEFYIDPTRRRALSLNCDNREINRRAIPWLKQHAKERFFMFVHYWDPHTPYLPPRAYRSLFYKGNPSDPAHHSLDGLMAHPLGRTWRETWFNKLGGPITDAAYIEALYDAEIRYCDEGIGQLLQTLDALRIAEDTLVILTSDHGELMYRHGIFFDHHGLYDGNLHVPLLFRHPSVREGRIPHLVAHVDLAPTVLDLCGIPIPDAMEGTSLAPLLRGETAAPVRTFVVSQECTWQMKWAIRTDAHKFILAREEDFYHTPMRELYDLKTDPDELRNIAEQDPATARTLESQLESWIAEKMRQKGLSGDPLIAHGITLGKAWKEERMKDEG
jgi:arylsulfatase A-like enzyme